MSPTRSRTRTDRYSSSSQCSVCTHHCSTGQCFAGTPEIAIQLQKPCRHSLLVWPRSCSLSPPCTCWSMGRIGSRVVRGRSHRSCVACSDSGEGQGGCQRDKCHKFWGNRTGRLRIRRNCKPTMLRWGGKHIPCNYLRLGPATGYHRNTPIGGAMGRR